MNNDTDAIVEVVEHPADRPEVQPRGDSVVDALTPDVVDMTDEELLSEAGVEPIFSTSEAAEFFDRSNQWLYWGLREKIFTHDDGTPIIPERIGDASHGRRRFTVPILKEIMRSSYRRGNLDQDQIKAIMRRIKFAERGVEWREIEGWKYVNLGRNRHRWVRPEDAMKDPKTKEWKLRPGVKLDRND
jgi:hypothetical protein